MHLPSSFIERIHRVFGDDGRAWLPHLPDIVRQCRDKWDLSDGVMNSNMSLNYIEFTTTADGTTVALKIGVPHSELFTEMETLRLYDGSRSARLMDADRALGAILMQHLKPGTILRQLKDNRQETEIAASIISELTVPVPSTHQLPSFSGWVERAFRLTRTTWDLEERMPRDLLDRAEQAFTEILQSSNGDVILHGDLHHENILLDEQGGWTAIDPKGVTGPHCLETGRYLLNFLPENLTMTDREKMVRERVAIFSAELGYSVACIAACGLVDSVLGHCWSFEEENLSDDWNEGVEQIRILERMLGT